MARSLVALAFGAALVSLFAVPAAHAGGFREALTSILKGKRWSTGSSARTAQAAAPRYWRLALFDDFKGRPSDSAQDKLCYDQMPAQCHIWEGGNSYRCDLAHLPESDATMIPPLRENLAAALGAVDSSRNWMAESLPVVKARYAQLVAERTRHLNKCTWTLYHMLNWMSTDYQGKWAARFDPLAVRVDPSGPGYLELSAIRAPIAVPCAQGGTLIQAGGGSAPDLCKATELPASTTVRPGLRYWVDSDARWPGVYYAGVNGACPYGGSGGSPNCQVAGFEPRLLVPSVQYALRGRDIVYYSTVRDRCEDNIVYLPNAIRFKPLACQILNGGMNSMLFNAQQGSPARGFAQRYGRFEAKLRIPRGEGAFPAAWLMPLKGGWPYSGGEIDILEARDNADEIYQTYHHGKCYRLETVGSAQSFVEAISYWDASGAEAWIEPAVCGATTNACVASYRTPDGKVSKNAPGSCVGRFALSGYTTIQVSVGHTEKERRLAPFHMRDYLFSVEWSPERIDYYVDNERTHTVAVGMMPTNNYATGGSAAAVPSGLAALGPHNFPHDPFYFILNHSTWVRPERRAAFAPQRLLIDYVKAWKACSTDAELCPCGGRFVEGAGCVLGAAALACPAGESRPAVQPSRAGAVYASPCQKLEPVTTSTSDKIAVAVAAIKSIIARRLQSLVASVQKAWTDVVAFFSNLKHWLEGYGPCVNGHVVPLARRLADAVSASARTEVDAFWRDVASTLSGFTPQDKQAALAQTWSELTTGVAARFSATRGSGVSTVRGWFTKGGHKDSAAAAFTAAFDGSRATFDQYAAASLAQGTR